MHFTANETIHGVEWKTEPVPPRDVPLVGDVSSDFISRPLDVSKYGLIYAGAQKNAGPAGVTVVIVRDDLLQRTPANLPVMLDYKVMAENGSLYNTPPCYSIYIVGLVLKWLKSLGGLSAIEKINGDKASLVYQAIDQSGGFYRGHAVPDCAPRGATPTWNAGHWWPHTRQSRRHPIRRWALVATYESVKALVQFMGEFQKKNG